jgi:hypothetical protein
MEVFQPRGGTWPDAGCARDEYRGRCIVGEGVCDLDVSLLSCFWVGDGH